VTATAQRSAPDPARPAPGGPPGLRTAVRGALPVWLASRVAVALLALAAARLATRDRGSEVPGFRALWDRWDVGLFVKVARYGYHSPAYADQTDVDFPALPLLLRAVHVVSRDWVVAGLVVSAIAGAVASVALWRLSAQEVGPTRASRAVLFLVLFPYAVFLFAGYSEALFLAFATTSWVAARAGRWPAAGLLAAGAAGTRVIGLALAAALAVEYGVARRRAGRPVLAPAAAWLLVPAAPVLAFVGYLRVRTGHWDAYTRAMEAGWGRTLDWPWQGFRTTWRLAVDTDQASAFLWFWRAELLAVLLGVVLAAVLARQHRWGEATFVGATTLLMSSSTYYASGVRAVLVWFPLYLLLARVAERRRWVLPAYVWTCAPLMAVFVVAFTSGIWVD
jgi:hypothetical protein